MTEIPPPPVLTPAEPTSAPKGLAIAALIVGIVAFLSGWVPIWGLIAGAVAVVLAIIALMKHQSKGLGVTGLILGAIAGLTSLVTTIIFVIGLSKVEEVASNPGILQPTTAAASEEAPGETTAAEESDVLELLVAEEAFGRTTYDATVWWFVVIIENPNADYIYDGASITVEALDADGVILDSSWTYLTLLSGETAITGTFFSVGTADVVDLNVTGPTPSEAILSPAAETGAFILENIAAEVDTYSTTVSGLVSSDFEEEKTSVEVIVVARDGAGQILGAATTYVDRVPSDNKARFEVYFFEQLPDDTTYEAFASV